MAENENGTPKKPSTEVHAYVVDTTGLVMDEDFIKGTTGSGKKCINKYELIARVPNVKKQTIEEVEAFLKDEWNLDLQGCLNQGVRNLMYKPDYHSVGFDYDAEPVETPDPTDPDNPFIDYPLKADGHNAMQVLLDGYKAGQRSTTPGMKAKAAKQDALQAKLSEAGLDESAIDEMIAKALAKKNKAKK